MENSSSKCLLITIGGYEALVDPTGLIIDTAPEIIKLRYEFLTPVFEKYKHRAIFKKEKEEPYPLVISDEIYEELVKTNPAIANLKEKFDCLIF